MMTSFTISQSKDCLQEEQDQSVSIVCNKDIYLWGDLINYRWLKILILNYLTFPDCLKCFLSDTCFSDLKNILEHFSSRLCFLHLFLVHLCLLQSLPQPAASQLLLSFVRACHLSCSPVKNLCSHLGNLPSKLHVF